MPCNWLQVMENSLDPVHTEWLHGKLQEFVEEKTALAGTHYQISRKHLKIAFAEFEYGVYKRRLLEGAPEDSDDWSVGHPVLFPNILAVGSGGGNVWKFHAYQMRVPVDDENTMHYWYIAYEPPSDAVIPPELLDRVPLYDFPYRDARGEYRLDVVDAQDIMAWITQGPIAQRQLEKLGTTDRGVILYRKMLQRELAKVAAEDPMNVFRPAGACWDSSSNATRRTSPTVSRTCSSVSMRAGRRSSATCAISLRCITRSVCAMRCRRFRWSTERRRRANSAVASHVLDAGRHSDHQRRSVLHLPAVHAAVPAAVGGASALPS